MPFLIAYQESSEMLRSWNLTIHRKLIKGSVRRATINVTHVLLVLMDVIVEMDHRGAKTVDTLMTGKPLPRQ